MQIMTHQEVTPGQVLDILLKHRSKTRAFEVSYGWEMAERPTGAKEVRIAPLGGINIADLRRPEEVFRYILPDANHVHISGSGFIAMMRLEATYYEAKEPNIFRPYEIQS